MTKRQKIWLGVGAVLLLVIGQRLFFTAEIAPTPLLEPVVIGSQLPNGQRARNAPQELANTLSALDQLSLTYNLTQEQVQDIRRIIESANYVP